MKNHKKLNTEYRIPNTQSGFTFIELITVVAIMILVGSVTLFKHSKFSSDILITNAAYEIALSIRQVEVFGLSSKGVGSGVGAEYQAGYGIHFSPALATGEDGNSNGKSAYVTFFDNPIEDINTGVGSDSQFLYQYTAANQRIDTLELTQGQKIIKYCAHNNSESTWDCWPDGVGNMVMNIVFVKPNPEAHITVGTISSDVIIYPNPMPSYDAVKIVVQSTLGDKCRSISVSVSGQISVDPIVPGDDSNGCDITLN